MNNYHDLELGIHKPDDIPNAPQSTYKNKGWQGVGDWLGTGAIATSEREYRPFEEARKVVRMLSLKSQKEWYLYCKSGNKPYDIPANPHRTYLNKGWQGIGDWLGTQ